MEQYQKKTYYIIYYLLYLTIDLQYPAGVSW